MAEAGANCRSGCRTRSHTSWGDCARAAAIQIDTHALKVGGVEKDKDKRLSRYQDARSQGLQPASTRWRDVRAAFETGGREQTPVVEKPATVDDLRPATQISEAA